MKKSKLSVGLVTGFIGAMALTACGSSAVTSKDKAIISFTPFNGGEAVDIVTDKMYDEYKKGSRSISDFYDKLLEVMVRYDFEKNGEVTKDDKNKVAVIEDEVREEIEQMVQNAKDTAATNGTSFETEWQSVLDQHGVEDKEELFQHEKYEKELTRIEDWYLKYSTKRDDKKSLLDEFIGIDDEGKSIWGSNVPTASSKMPYHISHILVSTSSSSFSSESLGKDESKKITDVFAKLTGGHTFGEIALLNSSDSSSSSYGDVDIMLNTASSDGSLPMYAEFQLAIYAFDGIFSKSNDAKYNAVKAGLGITADVKNQAKGLAVANTSIEGLGEVPANVFEDLLKFNEVEAEPETGLSIAGGNSQILPRNLLWNKYLNQKNGFIITNRNRTTIDQLAAKLSDKTISAIADDVADPNLLETGYDETVKVLANPSQKVCGFRKVADIPALSGLNLDPKLAVLTDDNANPIICVRSSAGLHFISITKSIYDFEKTGAVSLRDYYYFDKIPTDKDYPADLANKVTYVNNLNNVSEPEYASRAEKIKGQVKSYDSSYTYRIYEYLCNTYGTKFTFTGSGETIKNEIDNYILLQRETNLRNQEVGIKKAWNNYFKNIAQQNVERTTDYVYSTENSTDHTRYRIASEGCAIGFAVKGHSSDAAYKEGGACYYGK